MPEDTARDLPDTVELELGRRRRHSPHRPARRAKAVSAAPRQRINCFGICGIGTSASARRQLRCRRAFRRSHCRHHLLLGVSRRRRATSSAVRHGRSYAVSSVLPGSAGECRPCTCSAAGEWRCCTRRPAAHSVARGTHRYAETLAFISSWMHLKLEGVPEGETYRDNNLMQWLMQHGLWFHQVHRSSWLFRGPAVPL